MHVRVFPVPVAIATRHSRSPLDGSLDNTDRGELVIAEP